MFIKCLNGLEYSRDAFIQISLYYYCRDKPPKAVVPNPVSGALPTCKVQLQPSFSTSACNYQVLLKILKGSYDIAKKNIILCIWCNAMWLCGLRLKKTQYFPHTVHHCCPSSPRLSERVDFYKAHCSEKRGVLWLASYPVRCVWPNTSSVRRKCYAPHRIVMPRAGTTRLKQ